jgi:uncharacterized SAM-binding protein YcdF (DUF218 family)
MISNNIRKYFLINEAIRAVFRIIFNFIKFLFTNKYARILPITAALAGVLWVAGLVMYKGKMIESWPEQLEKIKETSESTDAIIVLTGTSDRLSHAFNVLGQQRSKKLFISGVNKNVKLHEILILMGYKKEDFPLLESAVELGYKASDTEQNAAEIEVWAKRNNVESLRVVTSNYHMPRALYELSNRLPDVKLVPHNVIQMNVRLDKWWKFSGTRKLLISEYNKYILAHLRVFLAKIKGN